MRYCSIYVTTASEDEAHMIGRTLVEEKLAEDANILPIKSVYRWRGNIEESGEAHMIGRTLVEEKLAAGANILPIKSVYRWRWNIEESGETAMFLKTRCDLVDRLIERVKELHSYEIPCIVSFPIEKGNPDYLQWVRESPLIVKRGSEILSTKL